MLHRLAQLLNIPMGLELCQEFGDSDFGDLLCFPDNYAMKRKRHLSATCSSELGQSAAEIGTRA
jgi:hypothetical protein